MQAEGSNISRPSITAAQWLAVVIAGVPIIGNLLRAFGVYTLSPAEQGALIEALKWAVPTAISLVVGDAGLRAARNHAHAKVAQSEVFRRPIQPDRSSWSGPDRPAEAPSGPPAGTEAPDQGNALDQADEPAEAPFPPLEVRGERILPHVVKRGTVACHSSRLGQKPRLVVIHDTEGGNIPNSSRDLLGIYNFFDRLATQASAHACSDNDGNSVQMVPDALKAWSCVNYNSVSLNIEQCHRQGEPYTDALIDETARWVAWWCRKWDIPVQRGAVLTGGAVKPGIVMHKYLGELGGGHHDPIPPWNEAKLLRRVKHFYELQQEHHRI